MHQSKAPLQRFDTHVEEGPFQYVSMVSRLTTLLRATSSDEGLEVKVTGDEEDVGQEGAKTSKGKGPK